MRTVKSITDPDAIELLGDETRRRIIYLLRARELAISQIAEELSMTPQAIYHHIKKMLAAGLVEVTREERVDNFIETYYRATAEVFEFSWGSAGKNQAQTEQRVRDALQSLSKLGINLIVREDSIKDIVETQRKIAKAGRIDELMEKVSKIDGVDFLGRLDLAGIASMASLTDKEFMEWMKLQEELRKLLRGLLKNTPRTSPSR